MPSVNHPLQHFFPKIISDAIEEYDGKLSIDGRTITSLPFAEDIKALAEEKQEL